MVIRKITRRLPRSVNEAELGHFTLLFCRGRQGKCTEIYNARSQLLEESIASIKAQNQHLHQELIDIRAHSMRSNLVFYNLPEVDKEDPFATVRDVLANKMKIDADNEIEIERG